MITEFPTQEQIKELWEWCGFEWHNSIGLWNDPIDGLISSRLPKLDLNNLFKYAVRKLHGITIVYPSVLFDEPTYEVRVWGTKKTTEPARTC